MPDKFAVPINYEVPDSVQTRYATHFVVQHSENEFLISFFEIWPPILLGTPNEIEAQVDEIESIPAKCVGRVVVAADKFPEFIRILQENLQSYLRKQE